MFTNVGLGFLKGEPAVEDALGTMPTGRVVIVPMLMSGGYFANTAIPGRLNLAGHVTHRDGRELIYGGPVGLNPGMDALVLRAVHRVDPTAGRALGKTAILLVAHGSETDRAAGAAARALADHLTEQNFFREVHAGFLEETPRLSDWLERGIDPPASVVGLFAGDGAHAEDDVRATLDAHERGRYYAYTGSIGAEPGMVALILDEARRAGLNLVG